MKKKLIWQLYFSYILLIALSLLTVLFYTSSLFSDIFIAMTKDDLLAKNELVRNIIDETGTTDSEKINRIIKKIDTDIKTRITIIKSDGSVLADSEKEPLLMQNHSDRKEFIDALEKGSGTTERYSFTLEKEMMYAAAKMETPDSGIIVVRTAMPLKEIRSAVTSLHVKNVFAAILIAIIAAIISFFVSQRINKQLKILKNGAARFSTGELSHKLPETNIEEIDNLSNAMNFMAEELSARISVVTNEKNKLETVLAGMVEGVVACDMDFNVLEINNAAKEMFGIEIPDAVGKNVKEVVRNRELFGIIRDTIESAHEIETQFSIHGSNSAIIEAKGTNLKNGDGRTVGALVVLHDITRISKLEAMRRDFVSNVSHELKTPITSIKGYIETLLDGAIDDPENARNFLQIISKQTSRLNSIIEDLLSLSRIEQEEGKKQLEMQLVPLKILIDSALLNSRQQAEAKKITINTLCNSQITAKVNANLIEQAISNLVDNAVKYCSEGSSITIKGTLENSKLEISVSDNGPGIAEEHLSRLFERFYRVDKARSRKAGGTGLGLSIVKHIAQAHAGTVSVKSTTGLGSTFTIQIPA